VSMSMTINYNLLPAHIRGGMKRYIEDGIQPGNFLTAVICDKLVESFAQADDVNIACMFEIAGFMYNEAPSVCRGSKEKMEAWMKSQKNPETRVTC